MSPEIFGWVGSLLLSVCSIPQAIQCYRQGHANGLSSHMIWLWGAGMFATFFYVLANADLPLTLNYGFNIIFVWSVIARYKFFPRK